MSIAGVRPGRAQGAGSARGCFSGGSCGEPPGGGSCSPGRRRQSRIPGPQPLLWNSPPSRSTLLESGVPGKQQRLLLGEGRKHQTISAAPASLASPSELRLGFFKFPAVVVGSPYLSKDTLHGPAGSGWWPGAYLK